MKKIILFMIIVSLLAVAVYGWTDREGAVAGSNPCDQYNLDDAEWRYICISADQYQVCKFEAGSWKPVDRTMDITEVSAGHPLISKCKELFKEGSTKSSSDTTTLTQSHYQGGKEIDDVWVKLREKLKTKGLAGDGSSNVWDTTTKSWQPHSKVYPATITPLSRREKSEDANIGEKIDQIAGLPSYLKVMLKEAAKSGKKQFITATKNLGDRLSSTAKDVSEAVGSGGNAISEALNDIISIFESEEDLSKVEVAGKGKCFSLVFSATESQAEQDIVEVNFQGMPVKVHKIVKPLFEKINEEIDEESSISYDFWRDTNGGTFNWRCKLHAPVCDIYDRSTHSFGVAIDINPKYNAYGSSSHDIPDKVITIFQQNDFEWGGEWSGTKDPMHFEWEGNLGDFYGDGKISDCNTYLSSVGGGELTELYHRYKVEIDTASNAYAVPKEVIVAIIRQESNGDARAVSPTGAAGLMQFVPATFIDLGGNVEFVGVDVDNDKLRMNKPVENSYKIFMTNGSYWGSCKGKSFSPCNDCQKDEKCDYTNDQRFNPTISINLGTKYLKQLHDQQSGNYYEKWTAAFKKYHGKGDSSDDTYAADVNLFRQQFLREQSSGGVA